MSLQFSKENWQKLPELPGVYLFKASNEEILYIGKAANLKKRVANYFQDFHNLPPKMQLMLNQFKQIEIILTNNEFQALLLEAKLIKKYQPKFNIRWRDDRHYIYIKITKEEFPKVFLSRRTDFENVFSYGPFPSAKITREILRSLRQIFPFCQQNENAKKACFYTHLGLCSPCPGEIIKLKEPQFSQEKKKYLKNIRKIKAFLEGKFEILENQFRRKMKAAAKKLDFETAAFFRDKLYKLQNLLSSPKILDLPLENLFDSSQVFSQENQELTVLVNQFFPFLRTIRRLECYDISHTFGNLTVGSMVTFIDNLPAKKFYRRFKIKNLKKNDDFAALDEVLRRRLKHQEWDLPDIIVVDGGAPQVKAFQEVMAKFNLKIPFFGIAKKNEELVFPKNEGFEKIALPKSSPALHLLQRIRDEAHRFAHQYHLLLRKKLFFGLKIKKKHATLGSTKSANEVSFEKIFNC